MKKRKQQKIKTTTNKQKQRNKKRVKARKRKYGFYALIVVSLALYSLYLMCSLLFYTQKIHVEGNTYSSPTEIATHVLKTKTDNSIGLWIKYNFMKPKLPVYLEEISVKMVNPWTIKVQVKEKKLVGGFILEDKYVYCDQSGRVQVVQDKPIKNILLVENVITEKIQKYDKIPKEKSTTFFQILDVQVMLNKYNITYDKVVSDENNGINIIIGGIVIQLGNQIDNEKIGQIQPIVEKLQGKSGILHLENFSDSKTYASFEVKE